MGARTPRFAPGVPGGGGAATSGVLFGRFTGGPAFNADLSDLTWTVEDADTFSLDAFVDPVNSTVITFPNDGLYLIEGVLVLDTDAPNGTPGAVLVAGSWPGPNYPTVFPDS